jgi:hypothetical protein
MGSATARRRPRRSSARLSSVPMRSCSAADLRDLRRLVGSRDGSGNPVRAALNTGPTYVASTTLTDPRERWVLPEPTRSAHRPALCLPPAALTRSTTPRRGQKPNPQATRYRRDASRDANWRRRQQRAQLQLDRLQPEPQVEGEVAVVDRPSDPAAVSSNLTGRALTRDYAAKP